MVAGSDDGLSESLIVAIPVVPSPSHSITCRLGVTASEALSLARTCGCTIRLTSSRTVKGKSYLEGKHEKTLGPCRTNGALHQQKALCSVAGPSSTCRATHNMKRILVAVESVDDMKGDGWMKPTTT